MLAAWLCFQCTATLVRRFLFRDQRLQPLLYEGMVVGIRFNGQTHKSVLWRIENNSLWLLPPLKLGLPVSFPPESLIELHIHTPGGLFSAITELSGCRTQPQAMIGLKIPHRWIYEQRRLHPRTTLVEELPAKINVNGNYVTGWLQDISAGGVRLNTRSALPAGGSVTLNLCSLDLALKGRIIACRRVLHNKTYEYELRIAFETPQTLFLCPPLTFQ